MYYANAAERPDATGVPAGPFRILPISVAMFLAWGPPTFPIRVGTEAVTAVELAARVEDWYEQAEPGAAPDPAGM